MRRTKWVAAIIVCVLLWITGCSGTKSAESVVKDLDKVIGSMESYRGSGTMTLHTGQQPLQYQVEVWYQKPQYYRIALTNAKKDITQIVLRNDDGVFVLTPKLNKSFRFQSDWPQNQGQVYLYQTLVQSILLDNSRQFAADEDAYVFDVMANYQNGSLARQKIWLNKDDYAPRHVEVSDASANVMVEVRFDNFEFDTKFDPNAFDMASNMGTQQPQGQQQTPQRNTEEPATALPDQEPGNTEDTDPADAEQMPDGQPEASDPEGEPEPDGTNHEATDGAHPEDSEGQEDADDAASDKPDNAAAGSAGESDDGTGETAANESDGAGNGESGETADAAAQSEFIIMEPAYYPEGVAMHDVNEVTFGGDKGMMMRFSGTYDYTLLQTRPDDMDAALVPGIMLDLGHTWGLLTGEEQQTLTWTYDGYEYRLTTASLPEGEMVKVAQSVMDEMNK